MLKKYIYANNASFRVEDGQVLINATPHFTMLDLVLIGEMAVAWCKKMKKKMPDLTNKWWSIPTLTDPA